MSGRAEPRSRGTRKILTGRVTSDKSQKTISVLIETRTPHPFYGKLYNRWTRVKAHDEKEEASEGDVVEIVETRPLSRTKRFRLLRVVQKAVKV